METNVKNYNPAAFDAFFDSISKEKACEHLEWVMRQFVVGTMTNNADYSEEFSTLFDLYLAVREA